MIPTGRHTTGAPTAPGVSPRSPVNKHQEQCRVEQLPVQLITRQAPPAACTQDIHYCLGALHYACLQSAEYPHHLAPFALPQGFPATLVRRCSHGYYEACVTLWLAPAG